MPLFKFTAKDSDGQNIEGNREAADKYDLARILRGENLSPLLIEEKNGKSGKTFENIISGFFEKVSLEEKMNFARNVGVMVGSGISLSRAFEIISLQLKKDYALRKKIKSATAYPVIIFIAMIAVGVLMMIYVVPSLTQTFEELEIELPASTAFIIFLSNFITGHSFIFALIAGVAIGGGFYFLKSEVGHNFSDWFFSHIPPFREINRKFNSARTCRTLSSLLDAGVPVVESLEITKEVIVNHLYKSVLEDAADRIKKGEPLGKAFLDLKSIYPSLVGEMVGIGEETGKLSQMLLKLAQFYENEVSVATKDLSTIIEPILMLIIGGAE